MRFESHTQVTKATLGAFEQAMERFVERNGSLAGIRWHTKLNPWVQVHLEGEYAFTGGGYTARHARGAVYSEYDHAPLPVPCEDGECCGTAWYRATVGAHKCWRCGELALHAPHISVYDLVA